MSFIIPDGVWERESCGHIRRKVGDGEDGAAIVEVWRCDECGDDLLDTASPDRVVTRESR